jgi:ABC-type multidrug transport system ATPase subunit
LGLLLSRGFFAEELTLEENLRFFGKLYGMDKQSLDERIEGLFSWAGLEHARRSPVFTLSTGQRQRLALVRVRLHEPRLLILDEPFNGLDEEALGFARDLFVQPTTVLFTSHDLAFAKELATTVLLIKGGRIVAESEADNPALMNVVMEALA